MRGWAVFALGLMAGCARPASPAGDLPLVRDLLDRLQLMSTDGGHGPHHRANNALQRDLWTRINQLSPGPGTVPLLLEAAECVYTRYDGNYWNGVLWHWPYLSSRRAIAICDRILQSTPDAETRERALWIKAFSLRCPATEPWGDAERDLETYAEQVRWTPDFEASREVYKTIAREFPSTARGKASARLMNQADLSLVLPKGPREPDPRNPDR
jgi:hypothetical protein